MKNQYRIVKPKDKKNIKIVDNENEFYLDINGTRLEGIKQYHIIKDAGKSPILAIQMYLDDFDFVDILESKVY